MRHYIILLLFICATGFTQNKPVFGINIGSTYSNIRGNEAANKNKYDLNFLVGGSIEMPMSDNLSFLINVNYERKTFKNTIEYNDFGNFDPIVDSKLTDVKTRLEYVAIPLNLKCYLDANKRFFINGGPFVGVFLKSQFKVVENKSTSEGNFIFKTLDFGANLGVGTRFKISENNSLNLEVRHNYGLTDISDVPIVNGGSVKTNSFNLIANWQFD